MFVIWAVQPTVLFTSVTLLSCGAPFSKKKRKNSNLVFLLFEIHLLFLEFKHQKQSWEIAVSNHQSSQHLCSICSSALTWRLEIPAFRCVTEHVWNPSLTLFLFNFLPLTAKRYRAAAGCPPLTLGSGVGTAVIMCSTLMVYNYSQINYLQQTVVL